MDSPAIELPHHHQVVIETSLSETPPFQGGEEKALPR
jgi:hypothetical protein